MPTWNDTALFAATSGWYQAKDPVRLASTANVAMTGLPVVDSVQTLEGDAVLLKDQTTSTQNGVWIVAAAGWTRRTDANRVDRVKTGLTVYAQEGTQNAHSAWTLTTTGALIVDTTALTFRWCGGRRPVLSTITAAGTTATPDHVHPYDATAGAFAISIPDAALYPGAEFHFVNVTASVNNFTMTPFGSQTINGGANLVVGSARRYTTLRVVGANLVAVSEFGASAATDTSALTGPITWTEGTAGAVNTTARTSNAVPQSITVGLGAPFATATGANRAPGNFTINYPGPTNGHTTYGRFVLQYVGADWLSITPRDAAQDTIIRTEGTVTRWTGTGSIQINQLSGGGYLSLESDSLVKLKINATGVGLYTTPPVAQATRVGQLTDSTGGTASSTLAAITAGAAYTQADMVAVKNALASITAKYNALELRLSQAGGGVGVTA